MLTMAAVVAINARYFIFYRAEQREDSIREANDLINDLNFMDVKSKFLNLKKETTKYMEDHSAFNIRRGEIEEEIDLQKTTIGDISAEVETLYDIAVDLETKTANLLKFTKKGKETADLLVENQEKVAKDIATADSYISTFEPNVEKFAQDITGILKN